MYHIRKFNNFINEDTSSKRDVINFINDFGFFISFNITKIQDFALDSDSKVELANMQSYLRKPIINGKKITVLTDPIETPELFNPRFLSAVMSQIRNILLYIKPRIERYVKDGDNKKDWLDKINKFERNYTKIVS